MGGSSRSPAQPGRVKPQLEGERTQEWRPPAHSEEGRLIAFLMEAASYFEAQPTNGEDAARWANTFNASNCRAAANRLSVLAAQVARSEPR